MQDSTQGNARKNWDHYRASVASRKEWHYMQNFIIYWKNCQEIIGIFRSDFQSGMPWHRQKTPLWPVSHRERRNRHWPVYKRRAWLLPLLGARPATKSVHCLIDRHRAPWMARRGSLQDGTVSVGAVVHAINRHDYRPVIFLALELGQTTLTVALSQLSSILFASILRIFHSEDPVFRVESL